MKKIITLAFIACSFCACKHHKTNLTGSTTDTADLSGRNKDVALASERAFASRNVDAIFKDCAPDFTDYGNGEGKPLKNTDSVKLSIKNLFDAFPDFKTENIRAVAEGNTVIVTSDMTGTFKKDFMGFKPTGKSFKLSDADIFTFNNDGKITSHRSIQSDASFLSQIGIPLPAKK